MQFGEQAKIAKQIGVSRSYFNDILKGRRPCSKKMAIKLASATGVPEEAWVFPERHPNPLLNRTNNQKEDAINE